MIFGPRRHDCAVHGHRFEARYDEVPLNEGAALKGATNYEIADLRLFYIRKVYVYDICTRCGQVVKDRERPSARAVA